MSRLRFNYQIEIGKSYLSPIFDLYIVGPRSNAPYKVLLDSGASHPIFHEHAAIQAGIDLSKFIPAKVDFGGNSTIGKLVDTYLLINNMRYKTKAIFVSQLSLKYGLLGRINIFSKFNEICFIEKKKNPIFELRK